MVVPRHHPVMKIIGGEDGMFCTLTKQRKVNVILPEQAANVVSVRMNEDENNNEPPPPPVLEIVIPNTQTQTSRPHVRERNSLLFSFDNDDNNNGGGGGHCAVITEDSTSLISFGSVEEEEEEENDATDVLIRGGLKLKLWNGKTMFSDFIQEGLWYQQQQQQQQQQQKFDNVVMLYESPSSLSSTSTATMGEQQPFYNRQVYKFHDYPPSPVPCRAVLGPCRYSLMNGMTYPSYLRDGQPPEGLLEHWKWTVPGFQEPTFVSAVDQNSLVYAYLPLEHVAHPLNDPHIHYHLSGKDTIGLMTQKTTRRLGNTRDRRPCVCQISHAMGIKGIYTIRNDQDEKKFHEFLLQTGNPPFIITDFIDIERNISGHFFLHPNGEITWFGSNETCKTEKINNRNNNNNNQWSYDSTIVMSMQEHLRDIQLPFVKDIVKYFQSLGFWGFCGVNAVFDRAGKGYLVDVHPRVTGSCPAIMVSRLLQQQFGFEYCLFRHSSQYAFRGSAKELFHQVQLFNEDNYGKFMVVIYSLAQITSTQTLVNLAVHGGTSLNYCEAVLNSLAPPIITPPPTTSPISNNKIGSNFTQEKKEINQPNS